MLSVVAPSSYNEVEIQKLVHAMLKKKRTRTISMLSERVVTKSVVWMPYYRVQFEYRRSEKELIQEFGETAQSETAINAMFCGCAHGENELFMLFRPNYVKYDLTTYTPRQDEIIGPTFHMDFDAFLSGFLRRLNETKNELYELRLTSSKRYARIRRYSRILPMTGELKETERFSGKIAELGALSDISSMCLNLSEDAGSIRTLSNSTFYYPTAVVELEQGEHDRRRFIIINLVKSGSIRKCLNLDNGLTQLCNSNNACKEVLDRSITQAASDT